MGSSIKQEDKAVQILHVNRAGQFVSHTKRHVTTECRENGEQHATARYPAFAMLDQLANSKRWSAVFNQNLTMRKMMPCGWKRRRLLEPADETPQRMVLELPLCLCVLICF
jgi:hypothetical protein